MSRARAWWDRMVRRVATRAPAPELEASLLLEGADARTAADRVVDAVVCLLGVAAGALFLVPELDGASLVPTDVEVLLDAGCGLVASAALWWRRRWPLGVALGTLALGVVSISATAPGLVALFSLAVLRPARTALLAAASWPPAVALFAFYSPTTGAVPALALTTPLVVAANALGMYVRARRMLVASLRERALRAEADQRQHEERARMAERTRIAREMHDVLAHRISLVALHAGGLEVRPDLPASEVAATAALMRSTARQALEELRSVIGLLRDVDGVPVPAVRQPTLADLDRLVEETRDAGAHIDLEMDATDLDSVPVALGRDAYRIVQEALTNAGKHSAGAPAHVRITGARGHGLHVRVHNPSAVAVPHPVALPGAGAGLLGLQERVQLSGGTLVHGPDGHGNFVVEANLQW